MTDYPCLALSASWDEPRRGQVHGGAFMRVKSGGVVYELAGFVILRWVDVMR